MISAVTLFTVLLAADAHYHAPHVHGIHAHGATAYGVGGHGCHKIGGCGAVTKFGQPLLLAQPVYQTPALPLIAQLPPPPPLVTVPKILKTQEILATPALLKEKTVFHKTGLIQVQLPQQAPIVAPAVIPTVQQYAVARPKLGKVVDQTEPTYFCKRPGFVLEGQSCVQTLIEPPTISCPGGFDTLEGACTRRASFLQTCPAGYTRREGQCSKLITSAFLQRCPEGSMPTEVGCERQVPHPLTPTCPEGIYDAITGTCVIQTLVEARAYCPEGFEFRDGTCIQEEVYDCTQVATAELAGPVVQNTLIQTTQQTPVAITQQAVLPVIEGGHAHHHHHGRILHAKDCETPCTQQPQTLCLLQRPEPCQQAAAAAVRLQQTQTTVTVQKTCTRVTSTALIFACEEGLLQGNQCLIKQGVAPTPSCTALGDVNFCYARQRVPVIQECPPDFTKECSLGRQCECVALEPVAFLQSCPSGFDQAFDGCVRTAANRVSCAPGYSLQGDVCVRILREPADCVFSVTYECDSANGPCLH
eukprot:Blabericola_migrator_1__1036@NODE_1263_length_4947_cov_479_727254_g853_i0_p2_GENE_NODE_1263_length_4947_cov_479_727254_g853_i0NODE_1263_length_4947_cov_479_727254_g853_i0_p2_ORF_typecomplete_len530_score71_32zfSAP30/PF13866_6/3_4e02zfSAP30/PF13866_6/1_3EGF_MSP1_1/PF12946_7/2_4e02EGF_MSP1_1/PF12946_7/1_9e02EGF_MSP1_1/PF12946_7/2_2e03EGF_MSP1_1/PF12946_7/7_8_NODE_1263_length_4947_cov_479_727254_g853_i01211710